jgi:transglutaminase-like putative cysteine protease
MPIEKLTFLEEKEVTIRDDFVKSRARSVFASSFEAGISTLEGICEYVKNLGHTYAPFRKRNAAHILNSRAVSGCTEQALVFMVLARDLGIPAKYVETFNSEWLKNPEYPIQGHVFSEVFDQDSKWRVYDPSKGPTPENRYILNGKDYTVAAVGIDFSFAYPLINGKFAANQISLKKETELFDLALKIRG